MGISVRTSDGGEKRCRGQSSSKLSSSRLVVGFSREKVAQF